MVSQYNLMTIALLFKVVKMKIKEGDNLVQDRKPDHTNNVSLVFYDQQNLNNIKYCKHAHSKILAGAKKNSNNFNDCNLPKLIKIITMTRIYYEIMFMSPSVI